MNAPRRLRVLISAYACGPGDESEASAGWGFVRAASARHDVCLVTRRRFEPGIAAALAESPELAAHLTVHYLELSPRLLARKKRAADVYWYYALWQRAIAAKARELHAMAPFDVTHHVTFAVDWLPCGLRLPDVPLVWGPVGGATYLPWRMWRWVGPRAGFGEAVRTAATRVCRRLWGDPTARRAALVVAQNDDVARRFSRVGRVVVEPNAALDTVPATVRDPAADTRRAIFVARLLGWKGARIAISALARPELSGWTLDVYGTGKDHAAARGLAERLGVADRVQFHGHVARSEVLAAMSRADVLVFPSLHDSAGWAVGEASAAGCPVVCFDHGGPPVLAGPNAHLAELGRDAVRSVAAAMTRAAASDVVRYDRWSRTRLEGLVDSWYRGVVTDRAAGRR